MYFHFINRNELPGGKKGSALRNAEFHLRGGHDSRTGIHGGWWFDRKLRGLFGATLSLGTSEDTIAGVSFQVLWANVHLSVNNWKAHAWIADKLKRRGEKYGNGRDFGIKQHAEYLWISIYRDPHGGHYRWWQWISINLEDLLKGKTKYESKVVKTERVDIPMPEGCYPATIEWSESVWKPSRWFSKRSYSALVRPDKPIPIPGKGENSWDCDEDAVWSAGVQGKTAWEVVGNMVSTVMHSRFNYGNGTDWRPEPKA